MPDPKAEILQDFDKLIAELNTLIAHIPHSTDGYYRGQPQQDISDENRDKFFEISGRCLKLLQKIDSKDTALQEAINYIRDAEVLLFNVESILRQMQFLRRDYEVGILLEHPRPPVSPAAAPNEKRGWLNEYRVQIVVALIAGFFLIAATVLGAILTRTPTNSAATTDTPTPILTTTSTPIATLTSPSILSLTPSPSP